jgi:hypothetical protein
LTTVRGDSRVYFGVEQHPNAIWHRALQIGPLTGGKGRAGGSIRVIESEPAFHQSLPIVDSGTLEPLGAVGIQYQVEFSAFEHSVVGHDHLVGQGFEMIGKGPGFDAGTNSEVPPRRVGPVEGI